MTHRMPVAVLIEHFSMFNTGIAKRDGCQPTGYSPLKE